MFIKKDGETIGLTRRVRTGEGSGGLEEEEGEVLWVERDGYL